MKLKIIDYGYKKQPYRAHLNDAGADVHAQEDITLLSENTYKIGLGFGVEIPNGYVGFVMPRSSLANNGITSELSPIDSSYTGEIHAILHNQGMSDYKIQTGDRIGQLVIIPIAIVDFVESTNDSRGDKGFGSTGK